MGHLGDTHDTSYDDDSEDSDDVSEDGTEREREREGEGEEAVGNERRSVSWADTRRDREREKARERKGIESFIVRGPHTSSFSATRLPPPNRPSHPNTHQGQTTRSHLHDVSPSFSFHFGSENSSENGSRTKRKRKREREGGNGMVRQGDGGQKRPKRGREWTLDSYGYKKASLLSEEDKDSSLYSVIRPIHTSGLVPLDYGVSQNSIPLELKEGVTHIYSLDGNPFQKLQETLRSFVSLPYDCLPTTVEYPFAFSADALLDQASQCLGECGDFLPKVALTSDTNGIIQIRNLPFMEWRSEIEYAFTDDLETTLFRSILGIIRWASARDLFADFRVFPLSDSGGGDELKLVRGVNIHGRILLCLSRLARRQLNDMKLNDIGRDAKNGNTRACGSWLALIGAYLVDMLVQVVVFGFRHSQSLESHRDCPIFSLWRDAIHICDIIQRDSAEDMRDTFDYWSIFNSLVTVSGTLHPILMDKLKSLGQIQHVDSTWRCLYFSIWLAKIDEKGSFSESHPNSHNWVLVTNLLKESGLFQAGKSDLMKPTNQEEWTRKEHLRRSGELLRFWGPPPKFLVDYLFAYYRSCDFRDASIDWVDFLLQKWQNGIDEMTLSLNSQEERRGEERETRERRERRDRLRRRTEASREKEGSFANFLRLFSEYVRGREAESTGVASRKGILREIQTVAPSPLSSASPLERVSLRNYLQVYLVLSLHSPLPDVLFFIRKYLRFTSASSVSPVEDHPLLLFDVAMESLFLLSAIWQSRNLNLKECGDLFLLRMCEDKEMCLLKYRESLPLYYPSRNGDSKPASLQTTSLISAANVASSTAIPSHLTPSSLSLSLSSPTPSPPLPLSSLFLSTSPTAANSIFAEKSESDIWEEMYGRYMSLLVLLTTRVQGWESGGEKGREKKEGKRDGEDELVRGIFPRGENHFFSPALFRVLETAEWLSADSLSCVFSALTHFYRLLSPLW